MSVPETTIERAGGCPAGGQVELATVEGGQHDPEPVHPAFETTIWAFLEAHPKP